MPTLTARTLITGIGEVMYPAIQVDAAGLIASIETDAAIRSETTLTPSFFDIHIHGAAGYDVMDATPQGLGAMQRFLARKGTGHYLATTVTAPVDDTLRALERLAAAVERTVPADEAQPVGIHLEGPFLSHAKRGVHSAHLLQPPSIPLFERFQQAARGHIRLLTVAPELEGALEMIAYAASRGLRTSLGHTNATAGQAVAGIVAGATSATHTFNAMRPIDHREPGVVGAVLDDENLFSELICDGIHVAPSIVRLWLRLKGDCAILVTDAMSATGMGDGPCTLAGLPVTVANGKAFLTDAPGTLAGSVLTLDTAVANLQAFTHCGLATAVRCASSHPATLLGLDFSLRAGQPASFNRYGAGGRFEGAMLFGEWLPSTS